MRWLRYGGLGLALASVACSNESEPIPDNLPVQTQARLESFDKCEDLEAYIKRIRNLEELSTSFEGVQQAFAIQAGREVRVIVRPDKIDDLSSARLARDIAKKIEETMQYPGQIKVTVIRETRSTEFAK